MSNWGKSFCKIRSKKEEVKFTIPQYGKPYICPHPVYTQCTLYRHGNMGLAVIQQRFNESGKTTVWTRIDNCLVDKIYQSDGFQAFFMKYAGPIDENGCYPTVTVRQIMRALKMKPLPKERWETVFDHKPI